LHQRSKIARDRHSIVDEKIGALVMRRWYRSKMMLIAPLVDTPIYLHRSLKDWCPAVAVIGARAALA
jgi:hypothetical protein